MCKYCLDDPKSVHHKDFIRGWEDPDKFEEEVNYKPKKKEPRPKKSRGCPENDFGPHVYVWVAERERYSWWPEYEDDFYKNNGFHRREYKVCCGCLKQTDSRYTEEMQKLIKKKGWYRANYG